MSLQEQETCGFQSEVKQLLQLMIHHFIPTKKFSCASLSPTLLMRPISCVSVPYPTVHCMK